MSKMLKTMAAASLIAFVLAAAPALAEPAHPQPEQPEQSRMSDQATPALTDGQRQELAELYKELYGKKKQVVDKYLEFGVISEEKAKNWAERMDRRYAKLEKHGFVPHWNNCDKKKKD